MSGRTDLDAHQRQEQRDQADRLISLLRSAHEARHSSPEMRTLAALAPVPAIFVPLDSAERKLGALVRAYALLVDQLMDER